MALFNHGSQGQFEVNGTLEKKNRSRSEIEVAPAACLVC